MRQEPGQGAGDENEARSYLPVPHLHSMGKRRHNLAYQGTSCSRGTSSCTLANRGLSRSTGGFPGTWGILGALAAGEGVGKRGFKLPGKHKFN